MKTFSAQHLPNLDFHTAVKKPIPVQCAQIPEAFQVESIEGILKGKPGDWLMIGAMGEVYVCDDQIFRLTYQLKNQIK